MSGSDNSVQRSLLQHDIVRERLAQGYLLLGAGVPLQRHIQDFCRWLLCLEKPGYGCGDCILCKQIMAQQCVDVVHVRPSGKALFIKMEDIQELLEIVQSKPMVARRRVCVLEDVQCLDKEAANAFLKTLEEPPSLTVFILTAPSLYEVLPTIVSRCRRIFVGGHDVSDVWRKDDGVWADVVQDVLRIFAVEDGDAVGVGVDKINERIHRVKDEQHGNKEYMLKILDVVLLLVRDVRVWQCTHGQESYQLWPQAAGVVAQVAPYMSEDMLLQLEEHIRVLRQHIHYNVNMKLSLSYLLSPLVMVRPEGASV